VRVRQESKWKDLSLVAEKIIKVDDLDGAETPDVAKRDFEVLDRLFTIDLSDDNDKRLREALETVALYLAHSNEVIQPGKGKRAESPAKIKGYTNTDVRAWAKKEGIEVSVRGKIADEVYSAFIETHPDANPDA
jgi:hypothetical protein